MNSLFNLLSIPLNQRYADKPSLLVLEHFFQLFLPFFQSESQQPSIFVKIHAGKFGEFVLDSRILPAVPNGASLNALLEEIGAKILAGGVLYEEIVNRKPASTKPAQLQHISNLMWFLQAKAEQKAGPFTFGAISIEDSELYLFDYFDSCKEAYKMTPPSFNESQSFQGKERSPAHRGIDFNPTTYDPTQPLSSYLNLVLPHQKRTVVVIPLFRESELFDGNRLLLKMEDHTAYNHIFGGEDAPLSSIENTEFAFSHVVDHAWGFIQSVITTITGRHSKITTKREHIPAYISNAYSNLILEFKRHKLNQFLEILQKDDPLLQSNGIRIMARNIENLALLSGNPRFPSTSQNLLMIFTTPLPIITHTTITPFASATKSFLIQKISSQITIHIEQTGNLLFYFHYLVQRFP